MPSSNAPVPEPAPVVPGYVLEELLGRGGSGQVWRARPRSGGEPVAVKVLSRGDPERQEREAALLAELDHPHLVRLRELVRREARGGPAEVSLVLDLLGGGSLAALLARRGRLRPGEVVTTVAPIAAALAHAHERGVVHGDLSPGNVVFTADGRPVLTDLGTARLVGDASRAEVTPPYVDPVVARGGAPGPASDVFGVAAAAFHALTGVAPWNAAGPADTLELAAGAELPDLAVLAPEAPAELVAVVLRGLSPDPHLRGSAAAFALDVRHACRPEPVRLPAAGVPDAVLGRTGSGPGTELTHQVPGRRREAAQHAAPPSVGRLQRWRAALPSPGRWPVRPVRGLAGAAVAVGVLLAAIAGAVWVGTRWGDGTDPVPAAAAHAATGSPASTPARPSAAATPAQTAAPPTTPGDPLPTAAPESAPGPAAAPALPDRAGWAALVGSLYDRRAAAFRTADAAPLADVYTADSSLLARDRAEVTALAGAGRVLTGFAPVVRRVTGVTTGAGESVVVDLVDEVPAYRATDRGGGGTGGGEVAGRGEAPVRMVLTRTAGGWRIAEATRTG